MWLRQRRRRVKGQENWKVRLRAECLPLTKSIPMPMRGSLWVRLLKFVKLLRPWTCWRQRKKYKETASIIGSCGERPCEARKTELKKSSFRLVQSSPLIDELHSVISFTIRPLFIESVLFLYSKDWKYKKIHPEKKYVSNSLVNQRHFVLFGLESATYCNWSHATFTNFFSLDGVISDVLESQAKKLHFWIAWPQREWWWQISTVLQPFAHHLEPRC